MGDVYDIKACDWERLLLISVSVCKGKNGKYVYDNR